MFGQRQKALTQVLVEQAGKDPLEDRFNAGYLAAIYDLFNVDVEEVTDVD